MSPKTKTILLVGGIIFIDLLSKLFATAYLPFEETSYLIDQKVGFYLTHNTGSTGGQMDYLMAGEPNKNLLLVFNGLTLFVLAIYLLVIKKKPLKKAYKWVIGIGIYLLMAFISTSLAEQSEIMISNWTASVVVKFAALLFFGVLLTFLKNQTMRYFFWAIIAAGIGNLACHFYSPYYVVDFLLVEGSYELLRIGIFNIADMVLFLSIIGIVINSLFSALRKKRNPNTIQ